MDGLDDIVEGFLVESHENLDQLDRDLIALEQDPRSPQLLSSVFRVIHTIKGASGFLAFPRLEQITHAGEDMLTQLRDGETQLTPRRTTALLRLVDTVRALLTAIERDGQETAVDIAPAIAEIMMAAGSDIPDAPTVPAGTDPVGPAPASEQVPPVASSADPSLPNAEGRVPRADAQGADEPERAESPGTPEDADSAEPPPGAGPRIADSTVRVDVGLLDELMTLVGELVLTRNQIIQCTARQTDPDLLGAAQRLNVVASELQDAVMKTRMQPIDRIWSKLPRLVRDVSLHCGKSVRLEMEGRDTELDRTLLEAIKDPLTHLVRNCVDHGIESPETRLAAGKPAEGLLTLRARHDSGQVVVEVADDGRGIDPQSVVAKALEQRLVTRDEVAGLTPADLLQIIFLPGFSTTATVTNVSGRGVGMDVVKTNVEAIGGSIEVESEPGRGTVCRLSIPLTLAIVPALAVECGQQRYAIPQVALQELVAVEGQQATELIEKIAGKPVHRLRGELIPLVRLADVLELPTGAEGGSMVIAVLRAEGRRFGLLVDRVVNTEEIVVKPVGAHLKAIRLYSGAAVLGDGSVALILDVQALARLALRAENADDQELGRAVSVPDASDDTRARVLLAGVGGQRRVAIPLDSVTRLERVAATSVERVGHREVIQYRGAILPVLRLGRYLHAGDEPASEVLDVVVYTEGGRSVAMVVEEIHDVFEGEAAARCDIDDLGLLGSAVLDEQVTELLDVRAAILAADPAFFSGAPGFPGVQREPESAGRSALRIMEA